MIFVILRKTLGLCETPKPLKGRQVALQNVLVWMIREQRLHGLDQKDVEINIKLDGRPFWGKDQVMVGLVPIDTPFSSSQSCKAVFPLAIANCKETRRNLELLLKDLTAQKRHVQKHGLKVDGKNYNIKFTVTADYKALLLCTKRTTGEEVQLGGQGKGVEACLFCTAIRGCACKGVPANETCAECFVKAKGDVGKYGHFVSMYLSNIIQDMGRYSWVEYT